MRTRTGARVWECEHSECYLALSIDDYDGSLEVFHIDSLTKNGVLLAEPIEVSLKDLFNMLLENGYTVTKTNHGNEQETSERPDQPKPLQGSP